MQRLTQINMLRRVLGVDESRTFVIKSVGEGLARLSTLNIRCKRLDGTWQTFDILGGFAIPGAVPGVGNLMFRAMVPIPFSPSDIAVVNDGIRGTIYMRVTDDEGTEILYLEGVIDHGYALFMMSDVVFDMPFRDYALTVEVGH